MVQNAYSLANFRFDSAENEPAKMFANLFLQKFTKAVAKVWQDVPPYEEAQHTAPADWSGWAEHGPAAPDPYAAPPVGLKGSIGEGPNHSNFSDQSSVKILAKFRNFSPEN